MKIFDIHSDLLYDLYTQKNKGVENRFLNKHVEQLKNSVIKAGVWTMYSPDDFNLLEAVQTALNEIDMSYIPEFNVMLGLEGLRNLQTVEDIDKLYQLGFRHAMLTWNEENLYATGVKGDPERGLTEEGKKLIKRMEELDMIIDVAHLNQKSFFDVLNLTNKNIIFSHGNVKEICGHRRNLTIEQMMKLKEVNGLFGLTLAKTFVNDDEDKRDLEHFLDHLDYAVEVMGINNVCFGFDFMDYLDEDFPNANIKEVPDATKAHLIIEGMKDRGYNDDDISKICYDNFYSKFESKLYYRGTK